MTRDTGWFKSTHSEAGNDNCVEVRLTPDAVGVRDSKSPSTGELWIPPATWTAALTQISTSS
jgi:Domain of unknown function (DUF397)